MVPACAAASADAAAPADAVDASADRPSPVAAIAAVGALAAFCAAGPLTAVVAAGAVVAATRRNDGLGEATRKTGELAADAVARARAFDREHKLTEKVDALTEKAKARAVEVEDKLKETHPYAAAALGTAGRLGSFAVSSTRIGFAAMTAKALVGRGAAAADGAARASAAAGAAAGTAMRVTEAVDGVKARADAVAEGVRRLTVGSPPADQPAQLPDTVAS